jgi:hypothetical protein
MDALERQAYLCALAGRCDTLQDAGGRSLSELMKLHHIARRAGVLLEQRAA